jgi:hypothetical protein
MALSFSTIPALKEYQALVNTDPEVDFFYNIVHLQVAILFQSDFSFKNSWIVDCYLDCSKCRYIMVEIDFRFTLE